MTTRSHSPMTDDRLSSPLCIGEGRTAVELPNRIFLAPMSGVSDLPFRRIASRFGAGLVVSEMVASRELGLERNESKLRSAGEGLPVHSVQLAGREPDWMAEAARIAEGSGADLIDINMGCPAKKVIGGASGSALMRDLDKAMDLIEATANAVAVPVTLKMRLGWDEHSINAPELAERAESAGVAMITVHGRTRQQFYKGSADWEAVRAVRERIAVPLVVNGDIRSEADANVAAEAAGADAVMVGRASYGRPWLPGEIASRLSGEVRPAVDPIDVAEEHYDALLRHYGADVGSRVARKHLGWYLEQAGAPDDLRNRGVRSATPPQVADVFRMWRGTRRLAA